jgi:CHAT domain-containing protein
MNFLPVHAAGDHQKARETGDAYTVLDRVTSSYALSLKILSFGRSRLATLRAGSSALPRAVLVNMPTTRGRPPLDFAALECTSISHILPARFDKVPLSLPTREKLLGQLSHSTIAHFACHGEVDARDPVQSMLQLADWQDRPLTVGVILRARMPVCQIAYLSACETAVNKDIDLRDEGIHLSAGFVMAGVPCVVASRWKLIDREAVEVAEGFYRGVSEGGEVATERSAEALRSSLLAIRSAGVEPILWGAYVHFGA